MLGRVFWITGLSGAGKTTLAQALLPHYAGAILLDGDALRVALGADKSGFDIHSRQQLALTYARLAKMLAEQGHIVFVATISLFHAVHAWNREHLPQYVEIFLDVSEHTRRIRDPKGLYAAEQQGIMSPMAGLQTPVELPLRPDALFTEETSLEIMVQHILTLAPPQ